MVRFGYTIVYVDDVKGSIAFFEEAFLMQKKFISEEGDYAELLTGETTLAFAFHSLGETNFDCGYIRAGQAEQPLGIEIALVTEDVDSAHAAALKHGALELSSPIKKPWGQVVSYVRAPSGVLIELCTPIQG